MSPREWDRAVEEIGPRLYRYFRFKGAGDQASDLTQETFIRVIQKIDSFDSSKGTLLSFSIGVATYILLEHHRKTPKLDAELSERSDENAFTEQLETLSEAERLKILVKRLPAIQQDALYFFYDEDLTTREISKILNQPEGTIKSHLSRAKDALREMMSKESRSQ